MGRSRLPMVAGFHFLAWLYSCMRQAKGRLTYPCLGAFFINNSEVSNAPQKAKGQWLPAQNASSEAAMASSSLRL